VVEAVLDLPDLPARDQSQAPARPGQVEERPDVNRLRRVPVRERHERLRVFVLGERDAVRDARADVALVELKRCDRPVGVVELADRVTPELVSERLGCLVEQPEYPGLDLAALCVR
jgi:hypothetical protein